MGRGRTRIISKRGWGEEIARRAMDAEEAEVFRSQARWQSIRYPSLAELMEDEARILPPDRLESLRQKIGGNPRVIAFESRRQKAP